MTKLEILSEIKSRNLQIAEILDKVQVEKRELTNVEKINVDSLKEEVKEFNNKLQVIDETPKFQRSIKLGGSIENEKFSLNRYFRSLVDPRTELNELEKELRAVKGENIKGAHLPLEFRATLAAGTAGVGQEIVSEEKFDLIKPLRAKSVLTKAGAKIISGVKGNVSIPCLTGSTAYWKGENTTSSDGLNGFTEVEFSPKRLTVYLPVSKLLLYQDTVDVENKLKEDLINAINQKLEQTILGNADGTSTQPSGIFYSGDTNYTNGNVVVSGTTSWSKVVALETGVNSANADVDNMYYIVAPETLGTMKTTAKASNTASFIVSENQLINGYPFLRTTNLADVKTGKAIAFGNWADLYILMWNNLTDVTVDNLTGAKDGIINYIINFYVDASLVNPNSVAKGWLT
jgi:HK97 family phage major capsid protein